MITIGHLEPLAQVSLKEENMKMAMMLKLSGIFG